MKKNKTKSRNDKILSRVLYFSAPIIIFILLLLGIFIFLEYQTKKTTSSEYDPMYYCKQDSDCVLMPGGCSVINKKYYKEPEGIVIDCLWGAVPKCKDNLCVADPSVELE